MPDPGLVARLRTAGCVFAEDEAGLLVAAAASPSDLEQLVARRCDGVPLEQLLGWAEFCGLRVRVAPGVFVPRRRTGLLVREAVRVLRHEKHGFADQDRASRDGVPGGPVVVDLCCGSGAVGLAVVTAVPGVELHAADLDPAATACAAANLGDHGHVHAGDLYAALPAALRGRVDVLVANAPYVPTAAISSMPPEARDHEPRLALDGGDDGVDLHRRVAAGARQWLAPGGALLVEAGRHQAPLTVAACRAAGLRARVETDDDLDATVVVADAP